MRPPPAIALTALVPLGLLAGPAGDAPLRAQAVPRPLPIEAAVRLGLDHAPRLEAMRGVMERAAADRREARSAWWPGLTAEGTLFRTEQPMIVAPLHDINVIRRPQFDRTPVQGNLALGYLLFDGGGRANRSHQAASLEVAAAAQAEGVEQQVIADVIEAYVRVLRARDALDAQHQRTEALQAEAGRVSRFLAAGRAARVDELRVRAALAQGRADSSTAARRLALAGADLARLLGLPPGPIGVRPVRAAGPAPGPPEAIRAQALEASPALRAAAGRAEAAEAASRAARADWFPALRLEGRGITYGGLESEYSTEWQAGVRLSYPLFTGGRRAAATARARAVAREARADQRELALDLEGQVDAWLAALADAGRRIGALDSVAAYLGEVVRTEALALREGAGVQTDYLRAVADLATARAEQSDARGEEVVARVRLAQVLGSLTLARVGTIVEAVP